MALNPKDLRTDIWGDGRAVVTHIPSGIKAQCSKFYGKPKENQKEAIRLLQILVSKDIAYNCKLFFKRRGKVIMKFAGMFCLLAFFVMGCSLSPVTFIGTGTRGVVAHFGKVQDEILDEGVHLKTPFVTSVSHISVRVQKSDLHTEASSKDLQLIASQVAINWSISPAQVSKLYQTVGDEDEVLQNILTPAVSEVFKAVMSKKTAEEIITLREQVASETREMLKERLFKYGVLLQEISVVDLKFSQAFSHAVEAKQVAEQEAKQAEYAALQATADAKAAVNKAKGQADSALLKARAEAEANQLKLRTLTPELIRYEAIQKWNGALPQVSSGGSGMIFDMSSLLKSKSVTKEE